MVSECAALAESSIITPVLRLGSYLNFALRVILANILFEIEGFHEDVEFISMFTSLMGSSDSLLPRRTILFIMFFL